MVKTILKVSPVDLVKLLTDPIQSRHLRLGSYSGVKVELNRLEDPITDVDNFGKPKIGEESKDVKLLTAYDSGNKRFIIIEHLEKVTKYFILSPLFKKKKVILDARVIFEANSKQGHLRGHRGVDIDISEVFALRNFAHSLKFTETSLLEIDGYESESEVSK